jgi:hypothetical protein
VQVHMRRWLPRDISDRIGVCLFLQRLASTDGYMLKYVDAARFMCALVQSSILCCYLVSGLSHRRLLDRDDRLLGCRRYPERVGRHRLRWRENHIRHSPICLLVCSSAGRRNACPRTRFTQILCRALGGSEHTSMGFFFAFIMFGRVAYLGSLRRRSVVTTAGVFIETVSTPPSTSLVMVAFPGASSTCACVRFELHALSDSCKRITEETQEEGRGGKLNERKDGRGVPCLGSKCSLRPSHDGSEHLSRLVVVSVDCLRRRGRQWD